jgi:predicted O-linked N-acetylglucosamine transferase (SPINDLY family)
MPLVHDMLSEAHRHHQAGRLPEAEALYRQILQVQPDHPDALHLLGLIAHHAGRYEAAVELIGKAICVNPTAAVFHVSQGEAYHAVNRIGEAAACYERALSLQPDLAQAHSNLGAARHAQGKLEEAVAHCLRALGHQPDYAKAHYNLALALQDQGKLNDAITHYRRAIALAPSFAEAHGNLGAAMLAQGKIEEAVQCYQKALALMPAGAEIHHNLGRTYAEQGMLDLGSRHYQEALRIRPEQTLWRVAMDTMAPVIPSDRDAISRWRGELEKTLDGYAPINLGDCLADVPNGNAYPSFYLAYQGCDERRIRTKFAGLFQTGGAGVQWSRPVGRPRIGFVVTAGHEAAFLALMRGVINHLSRDLRPTIICAPVGADMIRSALAVEVDRLVLPRSFASAIEAVREAKMDLLYHWEIGTDSVDYFLPFWGLAPVQCTSWGYPVTSGIPSVEYFISSKMLEPPGSREHYSETLVLLDSLPVFYYKPVIRSPRKDRAVFGVREGATLYACPQGLFKFHPDFDEALGGILRADRTGQLILLEGRYPHWTALLMQRFRRTIPDVLDRIRFLPRKSPEDFLQLLMTADVLLDPFHWSGGNISHDALAFGTPIVTLPGAYMRGRVTYGCYRQMGMMDCVASSVEKYVALAVRLGTDTAYRQRIRAKILAANGALYENINAVREMERFFLDAIARHADHS